MPRKPVLVLIPLIVLLAWLGSKLWDSTDSRKSAGADPVPAAEERPGPAPQPTIVPPLRTDAATNELPPPPPARRVRLLVELQMERGATPPSTWELSVETLPPHWRDVDPEEDLWEYEAEQDRAAAEGRDDTDAEDALDSEDEDELAPPRTIAVASGPRFEFDVEIGRYALQANSALGVSPRIVVRAPKDQDVVSVALPFAPFTSLVGRFAAQNQVALDGLEILFERPGSPEERFSGRLDAAGELRVERVPSGAWDLCVGSRDRPLVPRRTIELVAPLTELAPIELPPLASLTVTVKDPDGQSVANARVRSTGMNGGRFDVTTDAAGRAVGRFLPAGDFRVFASSAALGRVNQLVTLAPGQDASLVLVFERK